MLLGAGRGTWLGAGHAGTLNRAGKRSGETGQRAEDGSGERAEADGVRAACDAFSRNVGRDAGLAGAGEFGEISGVVKKAPMSARRPASRCADCLRSTTEYYADL